MATKTFEELKQLAIQIRDEKTNKQNTATRVGTAMLEHINKLEQDYYDKTQTDEELKERDDKLTELEKKSIQSGYVQYAKYDYYPDTKQIVFRKAILITATGEYSYNIPEKLLSTDLDVNIAYVLSSKENEYSPFYSELINKKDPYCYIVEKEPWTNFESDIDNRDILYITGNRIIGGYLGSTICRIIDYHDSIRNSVNQVMYTHFYSGIYHEGALHKEDGNIYTEHTDFVTTDYILLKKNDVIGILSYNPKRENYDEPEKKGYPCISFYKDKSEESAVPSGNYYRSTNIDLNKYVIEEEEIYVRISMYKTGIGIFFNIAGFDNRENISKYNPDKYPYSVDFSCAKESDGAYYVNMIHCLAGDIITGNLAKRFNTITLLNGIYDTWDEDRLWGYSDLAGGDIMGFLVPVEGMYQVGCTNKDEPLIIKRSWCYRRIKNINVKHEIGCLHTDGEVYSEHTTFYTSDYIEVKKGDIVELTGIPGFSYDAFQLICLYNSNKIFEADLYIQDGVGQQYILIPQDGYIRISQEYGSYNPKAMCYFVDCKGGLNDTFNGIGIQDKESIWKGKRIAFLGDSITEYGDYVNAYKSLTGCEAINCGISGTCIASGTVGNPMCERYSTQIPDDIDLVVVLGGVNDQRSGVPLGEFKYYNSNGSKNNTFYGALHTLMRGLKEKFPQKPIIFMTPMHNSYRDDSYGDTGDYNYQKLIEEDVLEENKFPLSMPTSDVLSKYVAAVKEVAAFYAIPVIDLYSISTIQPIIKSNSDLYTRDGIHPNTLGGYRIAQIIYPILENVLY